MQRIPTHLKLLRGNPGKRAIPPEPEPPVPTAVPEPPSFVQGYAADEWWRVGPELYHLKLLTALDVMPFAAYCIAYQRWRTAEELLMQMADKDPVTRGLLIKSQGGEAVQNPLIGIARRAANDMVGFGGEFGLSPLARARIGAGVWHEPPPGKFDGLLA